MGRTLGFSNENEFDSTDTLSDDGKACIVPFVRNALHITVGEIDIGRPAIFQCEDGYELDGDAISMCTERGLENRIPTCRQGYRLIMN